jgi:hypothetical protein
MEGRHIDGPHEHADGHITGTVELRGIPHPDVIFYFGDAPGQDWIYPPFPVEGHVLRVPRVGEWVDLEDPSRPERRRGVVHRIVHRYFDPQAAIHVHVRRA